MPSKLIAARRQYLQRRVHGALQALTLLFAGAIVSPVPASTTAACVGLSHARPLGEWELTLRSDHSATLTLALPKNRAIALEVIEAGMDVTLEVTPAAGTKIEADNPVRRSGVQRALVHTGGSGAVGVVVRAKVHGGVGSKVQVRAIDAQAPELAAACRAVLEHIAVADSAYAAAQKITNGQAGATSASAPELYRLASRNYELAFRQLDPGAELPLRAQLAHALAAVSYQDLKQWQEGAQWSLDAAALFADAHDAYARARAQALQAAAWMELAALPRPGTATEVNRLDSDALLHRAEDLLGAVARFHEHRGEFLDAALQRNNIGLASYYDGAFGAAFRAYGQALDHYQKVGYRYGLAQVTQNMALADSDLGRSAAALADYQRALQLISVEESPRLYADVLNNCGLSNAAAGHLDVALQQHAQALELGRRIQSRPLQARSLFGIGLVYEEVGDRDQASEFLREALDLWGADGDGRNRVGALRVLASVEAARGNLEESVRLEHDALSMATEPVTRARLLVQMADGESRLQRISAANEDLALAAQVAAPAGPISHAVVDLGHGLLELRQGHLIQARRYSRRALSIDRALGLNAHTFDALVALARIEIAAGREDAALGYLDQGLALSEVIRVAASNPELRASSMQSLRAAYELEVDIWAHRAAQARAAGDEAGVDRAARAALEITERSRARAMQDISLADYAAAPAATLAPLLARKSGLIRDIAAHEDKLQDTDAPASARAVVLRRDVGHLREQLALVDTRLAALGQTPQVQHAAASLDLGRIPADTAVVAYWVGETHAYAWVATRSALHLTDLGASAPVRASAEAVHAKFNDLNLAGSERLGADADLGALALQPVLPGLPADIRRLVIIPDGPLQYVSFAVLPTRSNDRGSFLVARYELAYGASLESLLQKSAAGSGTDDSMLLVDDAVYGSDDPRSSQHVGVKLRGPAPEPLRLRSALNGTSLQRLPATAEEGAAIVGAASPIPVDHLEGFAATRDAVLNRPLERYRYIHFAVHAMTDAQIPQLSSLIMSTHDPSGRPIEDHVWAGDLMTRRFNARTVVLSACNTALGADINGEGLLGLRYVILARGAQSVVASLWSVPDRTTELLMQNFYVRLLREQQRPALALASAMREVLREGPRDPAFWAGFTATVRALN
ncbi:MAG TPA: CHAT domain-containing protein [Steroidobacteraceae bacterium]|nr:CHAT domain-containing protein [Steroidobacteraceae bacterium]